LFIFGETGLISTAAAMPIRSRGNFRYSRLDRQLGRRKKMPRGTVKLFKMDRGYGFFTSDDRSGDVFVHVSELQKAGISSLAPGQKVTFDVETDKRSRRLRAVNVRIAE
jgi:cold shock protein